MRREQVKRMLESYRQCAARRECLRLEIPLAQEQLALEQERALESDALPRPGVEAPRGGGPGDPTARLAVRYASGYQPRYIREMAADVRRMQDELRECDAVCRYVDAWRGALNDRERLVVDLHMIGGETYAAVLDAFARRFPAAPLTSPDGVKCVNQRALEKICAAAGGAG